MEQQEILPYRLSNQQIVDSHFTNPEELIRWFGAIQAQDYLGSLWAIGLRLKTLQESIEKAIAEKKIVRTWPMRGTLHFVPAEDIRWMLSLSTHRVISSAASRHRQLELDEDVFRESKKIILKALEGGKILTRDALYHHLEEHKIATRNQRGLHILWNLSQKGVLCLGPRDGKKFTFVLLDEWIPTSKKLDRDEAVVEFTKRYFQSHGPATLADFVWWSGLLVSEAKKALSSLSSKLTKEQIDGEEYFMISTKIATSSNSLSLIPPFDEFLVAYKNRSLMLGDDVAKKANLFGNGIMSPLVLHDGKVVATWKRAVKENFLGIRVKAIGDLYRSQPHAIEDSVRNYAKFLGIDMENVSLSFV